MSAPPHRASHHFYSLCPYMLGTYQLTSEGIQLTKHTTDHGLLTLDTGHINSSIIFLQHFYVQCFLVRHTTDRSSLMLDPNKYDLSISIIDAGIYAAYVANYLSLNSSTTLIQRL